MCFSSGNSSAKKEKEMHHRSKIRKFKKKSEVWGNKFDFKAISKQKVRGLTGSLTKMI